MTARVRSVPIETLKPDTRNANRGTERGRAMLERSIERLGAGRSIVVDRNDNIIAGNKTHEVALEKGIPIQIVETHGDTLVVVKRTDLDLYSDTDGRARELAYADNRVQEVDYQLDLGVLKEDIKTDRYDLSYLYNSMEMEQYLSVVTVDGEGEGTEDVPAREDEAEALQQKWGTAPGQLWVIGAHRLLCGDSENPEHVARLFAGNAPALMVTDPPYGVSYDAAWRTEASEKGYKGFLNKASRREGVVANDDKADWRVAYALSPASVAYVWHSGLRGSVVQEGLEEAGFELRNEIIWVKSEHVISRGHYNWQHEPCFYAVRKNQTAQWQGDQSQSTCWFIGGDETVEGAHSTQKPLECMLRPLVNHSGDVYDPFVGTGTTMVAAEKMKVRCFAIDIAPRYVAVTLERMASMGLEPHLEEDGR